MLGSSLAKSKEGVPTLAFRITPPGAHTGVYREVHLPGHQDGIETGDRVKVLGIPMNGCYEAYVVVNESTHRTLYRRGMPGLIFNLLVLMIVIVMLISALASRGAAGV